MRRFEWDSSKEAVNLRKHGIGFTFAKEIFDDALSFSIPDDFSSDEFRYIETGMTADASLLVDVYALWYDDDTEVIRIISARKAQPHERRIYQANAGHAR